MTSDKIVLRGPIVVVDGDQPLATGLQGLEVADIAARLVVPRQAFCQGRVPFGPLFLPSAVEVCRLKAFGCDLRAERRHGDRRLPVAHHPHAGILQMAELGEIRMIGMQKFRIKNRREDDVVRSIIHKKNS